MMAAFTCATLEITPTVRHADYIGNVARGAAREQPRDPSATSKATEHLLAFRPQPASPGPTVTAKDAEAVR